MGASIGKFKRSDDGSNRESQKPKFRLSAARKRGTQCLAYGSWGDGPECYELGIKNKTCPGYHCGIHVDYCIARDERNKAPSSTTLYGLPLELLDIILQKSYLHWISNSSANKRDDGVIRSLISVDVCFNLIITRQRFKKTIWRHLKNERNKASSSTTLYGLPLELLDIILQKSYLHWISNSSANKRDDGVIRSLISVDVCFNRRMTRQRFKKRIWRHLKNFYEENKKHSAICRNNKNYIVKNFQPNDEFINSLLSLNCITEKQSHFIQRQRSTRDKNAELLRFVRSFDDKKFSNFAKCLRQTNQTAVAKIVENGGVAMEVKVKNYGTEFMNTKLLHQRTSNLRKRTNPRSHETDKLVSQLLKEGIEILNSQPERQTVVVWIWCRSQIALENIQKLYKLNQLRQVLFENNLPSISTVINIDRIQFRKTVVLCSVSINFTKRIQIGLQGNEFVLGVTKLRNEIYILCAPLSPSNHVICVFEDRNPFRFQRKLKLNQTKSSGEIWSCEKENCLYVSDSEEKCIWKITRETNDEHKVIKWLTTDYQLCNLSVSSAGQLLIINGSSSILMIYGSDAKLLRSIQLPTDIARPLHAVETSIGNFIILHDGGVSGSSGQEILRGISELTRDGRMVIRRFISSNKTKQLIEPSHLSIDSDDRVFVTDYESGRVILLDFDLKWNRILCPTKEKEEGTNIRFPFRLYYDDEKKQLIVVGYLERHGVNVYTLSRN